MPKSVKFLKSAVYPQDYPQTSLPEIAIAGRSNAGKSSFINALTSSKIAMVSQTPGKTRLLNFFNVEDKYMMVDTPGYGYASRSGDEVHNWQAMIEQYLLCRENLKALILVMDARRDWSDEEEMLKRFCLDKDLGFYIVLTKADKISRNEQQRLLKQKQNESGLQAVRLCSSLKNVGITEIEEDIYNSWLKEFIPKDFAQRKKIAKKESKQWEQPRKK